MKKINRIQKLQFELMKKSSFNSFNGKKVVESLMGNRDLWKGVIFDRAGYCLNNKVVGEYISLIKLRDIEDNIWNADTLFILPSGKDDKKLKKIAETWSADEVTWENNGDQYDLGSRGSKYDDMKILRVWWD